VSSSTDQREKARAFDPVLRPREPRLRGGGAGRRRRARL